MACLEEKVSELLLKEIGSTSLLGKVESNRQKKNDSLIKLQKRVSSSKCNSKADVARKSISMKP